MASLSVAWVLGDPGSPRGKVREKTGFQDSQGASRSTWTRLEEGAQGSTWRGGWHPLRPQADLDPTSSRCLRGQAQTWGRFWAPGSEDDLLVGQLEGAGWAPAGRGARARGVGAYSPAAASTLLPPPRTPAGPEAAPPPPLAARAAGWRAGGGRAGLCSGPATPVPLPLRPLSPTSVPPARLHRAGSGGEANLTPADPSPRRTRVRPRLSHGAPAGGSSAGLTRARPGGRAHTHSGVGRRPPSSAWRGWGSGSAPSRRT